MKLEQWTTEESLNKISKWASSGLTQGQIAANMGIHRTTLQQWMKNSQEISDAVTFGSAVADYRVENALYEAAISGNITAMIFWLKCRRPDKWNDHKDPAALNVSFETAREILDNVPSVIDKEDEHDKI